MIEGRINLRRPIAGISLLGLLLILLVNLLFLGLLINA
jgi:hypothetical protein